MRIQQTLCTGLFNKMNENKKEETKTTQTDHALNVNKCICNALTVYPFHVKQKQRKAK